MAQILPQLLNNVLLKRKICGLVKTRITENSLMKLLLLLLFVIIFMQGSYNFIPNTNHVSRVHSFAAIVYLRFLAHVMLFPIFNILYFNISTSRSMSAAFDMAVFCSFLISCSPVYFKESMLQ